MEKCEVGMGMGTQFMGRGGDRVEMGMVTRMGCGRGPYFAPVQLSNVGLLTASWRSSVRIKTARCD